MYGCEPFQTGQEFKYLEVWITVDGVDSNKKMLRALKPISCD
jgi:hypothetical protein